MDLRTIGRYLVGRRDAIEAVAVDPRSPLIGLALVFAASFAREYDAEYLLMEPAHLLFGPTNALIAALVLMVVVHVTLAVRRRGGPGLLGFTLPFLGLFWMTAPLAFLYAIPVERFLTEIGAVQANLWMLAVVATWRVVLMVRVVSVVTGVSAGAAVAPVLLMGSSVALVAVNMMGTQILAIMGGVNETAAERLLRVVAGNVFGLAFLATPIFFVAACVVGVRVRRAAGRYPLTGGRLFSLDEPHGPWWAALGVIVALVPAMFVTQPEQRLRREFEWALGEGDADAAIELLRRHERSDFPPHFRPRARHDDELQRRFDDATRHWSAPGDA